MEELRRIFFRYLADLDSDKILDQNPAHITEVLLKKAQGKLSYSEANAEVQKLIKLHCCDVQCMIFVNFDGERFFIPKESHRKSLRDTISAISHYAQEAISLHTTDGRPVDDFLFTQLFKLKSQSENPILNLNAKRNRKRKASEALRVTASKRVKIKAEPFEESSSSGMYTQFEEMLELILKHQEKLNSNLVNLPSRSNLTELENQIRAKLTEILQTSSAQEESIREMKDKEDTLLKRVGSLESQVDFLMKKISSLSGLISDDITNGIIHKNSTMGFFSFAGQSLRGLFKFGSSQHKNSP